MSERDDFGAFLMGFIVGGLTGAAVSLLMAPQSGEETRTVIREKAIELRDRASSTVEEAYAQAEAAAQEAVHRAEDLLDQAKARADEVRARGQDLIEEQKGRLGRANPQPGMSAGQEVGGEAAGI